MKTEAEIKEIRKAKIKQMDAMIAGWEALIASTAKKKPTQETLDKLKANQEKIKLKDKEE